MAGETIILTPTHGDPLTVSGAYKLTQQGPDWGDHQVSVNLARGVDVVGGVVSSRVREPRTVSLPVRVSADTAAAYLTAAAALQTLAANLALVGGVLTRQVVFEDDSSEVLELSVLGCDVTPEEGWLQAHRRTSVHTFTLTCEPAWLSIEHLRAAVTASTDTLIEVPFTGALGNLPGPTRIVLRDEASLARRFVELGAAFYQDISAALYEFTPTDFDLTGTDSTLDLSEADALSGNAVVSDPILSSWRPVAYLFNLPHNGSYRVRARVKGGSEDADVLYRIAWRPTEGVWKANRGAPIPDSGSYFDVDCGSFSHFEAQPIDLRVEMRGTDTDTASDARLDQLTILPAELYSVSRGLSVHEAPSGLTVFDDFTHDAAGDQLDGTDAPIGPATFTTWNKAGDTGPPDWLIDPRALQVVRDQGAADADLVTGQFQLIGDPATTDCTVTAASVEVGNTGATKGDETRGGVVARYGTSPSTHWLMCVLRIKKINHGYRRTIACIKRKGATTTILDEFSAGGAAVAQGLFITVDGSGQVSYGTADQSRMLAADSDLAGGGNLASGTMGLYSAANHAHGFVDVVGFSADASATLPTATDVVRMDGQGEMTSTGAFSEDNDGSNIQSFDYEGPRPMTPPVDGRLLLKVRTSDSESEPDEGAGEAVTVLVYRRAAWVSLSDAAEGDVEPPPPPDDETFTLTVSA